MPGPDKPLVYEFGDFVLDLGRGTLLRGDEEIRLRPKSFEVLRYLVENAGRLVSKAELMDAIWGRTVVTEGSLTQCVADVRRALADDRQALLRTISRRGFIFDLPVHLRPMIEEDDRPVPGGAPQASRRRQRVALVALVLAVPLGLAALWSSAPNGEDDATASQADCPPTRPSGSLAVLPFTDLGPQPTEAHFGEGLAEEILHLLTQSPQLKVSARSSSFQFRDGDADPQTIGCRLNVAHLLEGSLRQEADRLRVNARLVDAVTGMQVWSYAYEQPIEDLLDLQQAIAGHVATALKSTLNRPSGPLGRPAPSREAHQAFLLGLHHFNRRHDGDLERARVYFEQAVELAPFHARAWAALAGALNAMLHGEQIDNLGIGVDEAAARQGEALERALAAAPDLAEAHARMSQFLWARGEREAARQSLARAAQLAPHDALVLSMQAGVVLQEGHLEEAVALQSEAVGRDPLSRVNRVNLGVMLLAAGQADRAMSEFRRAAEISQDGELSWLLGRAQVAAGRPEQALQSIPGIEDESQRLQIMALAGPESAAAQAVAALRARDDAESQLLLAEVLAHQGRVEESFRLLFRWQERSERAGPYRNEATFLTDLNLSPFLASLRGDPRWLAPVPVG